MQVFTDEIARHTRRVEADDRRFVVNYWLVREQLGGGVETHFVRCCRWEVCDGRIVGVEAEVAGLGADPVVARVIYDQLVAGGALPIQLQELALDARREFETLCRRGWFEAVRHQPRQLEGD